MNCTEDGELWFCEDCIYHDKAKNFAQARGLKMNGEETDDDESSSEEPPLSDEESDDEDNQKMPASSPAEAKSSATPLSDEESDDEEMSQELRELLFPWETDTFKKMTCVANLTLWGRSAPQEFLEAFGMTPNEFFDEKLEECYPSPQP
jgi:hypothetical protein